MKHILGMVFSAAWRILLAIALCVSMIVLVFALLEVTTGGDQGFQAWLVLVPAAIVAVIGPIFLFSSKK